MSSSCVVVSLRGFLNERLYAMKIKEYIFAINFDILTNNVMDRVNLFTL